MKATINGIEVEGTPSEIASILGYMGNGNVERIRYVPYYPSYPIYPVYPTYPTYPNPIITWCNTGSGHANT